MDEKKMRLGEAAWSLLLFFLIFAAASILLSHWIGFLWLNSAFIAVVSLVAAFFLAKKFPAKEKIPLVILLLALLVFALEIYPSAILHPGYQASNDAAQTITLRVLGQGETIPETYAPYSNLKLTYQIGFHLFVKIFADFLPFVKDYLLLAFFGALFGAIQLILLYVFAKNFFKSERIGFWAAILFLGAKIVFQNMYYGMFPWMIATAFFLAAAIMLERKSPLFFLFLPMIFLLHQGVAFYSIIFFALYAFFEKVPLKTIALALLSLLLALPSFILSYLPIFSNFLAGGISKATSEAQGFSSVLQLPLLVGVVPSFFVLASIIFFFSRKDRRPEKLFFAMVLAIISSLIFLAVNSFNVIFASKLLELTVISALLLGALGAAAIEENFLNGKPFPSKAFKAVAIAACLFFFFSIPQLLVGKTGFLDYLRDGSKITADEAHVAFELESIAPELSTAAFFSDGAAKMAELSNKIPFDVKAPIYIPYTDFQAVHDSAFDEINQNHEEFRQIIDSGCVSCINALNVEFVVINTDYFNHKLDSEPLFSFKNFFVYRLNEPQ
ncbi:MAG: hypothetical protein V1494_07425 [Candidatus Diapherotrites archaeon]